MGMAKKERNNIELRRIGKGKKEKKKNVELERMGDAKKEVKGKGGTKSRKRNKEK